MEGRGAVSPTLTVGGDRVLGRGGATNESRPRRIPFVNCMGLRKGMERTQFALAGLSPWIERQPAD